MASVKKRETSRGARYDVRYRDLTGRAREKTFRRRADADRFAREVEVNKDRGLFVDPKLLRTPLAKVAADWLDSNPGKRGGSWQRDEIVVRCHLVPALGQEAVGALTPADVQRAVNGWAAKLAPRTVRRNYGVLASVMNYAVRLDMIGRSPCRAINLPKPEPVRPHIVDAAELAALAKALGGVGDLGPMAYLATVDGLRWGEVAGLRVRQLDIAAGTLAVTETIVRGRRGRVEVGQPKSAASRRTLPVPAALMAMLVRHMAARGLTAQDGDALLFVAPGGGMLRYSNWLRRRWYPAAVAAGVGVMVEDEATGKERYEGLGFHDLRRASATGLVAAGVDVKTAQSVLGHTDARVTLELYAQVVTEQHRKALDAMGAQYLGPSPRAERGKEGEEEGGGTGPETRERPSDEGLLSSRGGGI